MRQTNQKPSIAPLNQRYALSLFGEVERGHRNSTSPPQRPGRSPLRQVIGVSLDFMESAPQAPMR